MLAMTAFKKEVVTSRNALNMIVNYNIKYKCLINLCELI